MSESKSPMKRFISLVSAAMALVLIAAITPAPVVSAATSSALSIIPRKNYILEPGKSVTDKLTVSNLDGRSDLNLNLRMVDFTFTDQSGTPKILLGEDEPTKTWSLKPFTTLPKQLNVPAGKSMSVDYTVTIPKNMGAGSYYSAIVYSSGAPDSNGNGSVGLSASGVTLAFVTVPGDVKEEMKLTKFGAYNKQSDTSKGGYVFIAAEKPEQMAYTLKNNGNVFESPAGSITIKHMFGKEQTIDQVNPTGSLALIGQERLFTTCIKSKDTSVNAEGETTNSTECEKPSLWPGRYSASLSVYYGQNGNATQTIEATGSFWYLPWWFVIAFFVVILLIAYAVWRVVKKVQAIKAGSTVGRKRRKA